MRRKEKKKTSVSGVKRDGERMSEHLVSKQTDGGELLEDYESCNTVRSNGGASEKLVFLFVKRKVIIIIIM